MWCSSHAVTWDCSSIAWLFTEQGTTRLLHIWSKQKGYRTNAQLKFTCRGWDHSCRLSGSRGLEWRELSTEQGRLLYAEEPSVCECFLWAQNKSPEILHCSDNSLMLLLAVIEELAGSHLCHLTKIFSHPKGKAILPGISFPTTSQPSSFRTMWMLSSFPAGKSLFWLVLSALQL